jgi:nucleotide-binding universal stress UspA family protein
MTIKRILVGLGGAPSMDAEIRCAVELAKRHQAELTGVTIVDAERLRDVGPVPMGMGTTALAEELREKRLATAEVKVQAAINQFAMACEAGGVSHGTHQETGDEFQLLAALSRYHDLVILGLHGIFEFGLVPEPHNSLARLVAAGVRPILSIGEQCREIGRVLISYSGSLESAKAMKRFIQMRLWPQATVRLVVFEGAHDDPERLLDDAATYCRAHGFDPETDHVPQAPEKQLRVYADEWGADLIVAGNSVRSVWRREIFGDTALDLMRHSTKSLFLAQ